MTIYKQALELHEKHQGKMAIHSKVVLDTPEQLALAYSPGVAGPSRTIALDPDAVYKYTNRGNLVAVVSDGTAVLGLGNIGPLAALPVMEGKAILFKHFAGVDAFPICLDVDDADALIAHVKAIAPTFGGINLEDIAAPDCFYIEEQLKAALDIPVFHDDQHGTAVVAYAGLINALKLVNKQIAHCRIVILGAGSAGIAIAKILSAAGAGEILVCDRYGILHQHRLDLTLVKRDLVSITNPKDISGSLATAVSSADVFIGVSAADTLSQDMVRSMADDPVIFALANPEPEIAPEAARQAGARIIATGRSDYPNQVNNVLGFPGIFRGALDVQAVSISDGMKVAAAKAIADLIPVSELHHDYIIPGPFDEHVAPAVAAAVAKTAATEGLARRPMDPEQVRAKTYAVSGTSCSG